MATDFTDPNQRIKLIGEVLSDENRRRKLDSFNSWEVHRGNIKPYVSDELCRLLGKEATRKIPIVSTINLSKRITDIEASIYNEEPIRTFNGVNENQAADLEYIYSQTKTNELLKKMNVGFRQEDQSHIMITPNNMGKYKIKVLKNYQLDIIPDDMDPETAQAYIISGYDRDYEGTPADRTERRDGINQGIADADDNKKSQMKYIVWTTDYHFIMNDKGEILTGNGTLNDQANRNPIAPVLPFIEIGSDKDMEYWVRSDNFLFDLTVGFNAEMSKYSEVVQAQAFAQAYFKGPKELQPAWVDVGPTRILRLLTDPHNNVETEFGFVNPNPNLEGSRNFIQDYLGYNLTSRSVDPKSISGTLNGQSFSSGVERFLALIEKYEASREDISAFRDVEDKMFELYRIWNNTLIGRQGFDPNLITTSISADASVSVEFKKPEMMTSQKESFELMEMKREAGAASRIDVIMDCYDMNRDEAVEKAKQIDSDETDSMDIMNGTETQGIETNGIGSQPDDQPQE